MSTKEMAAGEPLTFTRLFAQRGEVSFAQVLYQCFSTDALLDAFNRINRTSLVRDTYSGRIAVRNPDADLQSEVDLFASFAWRDVFATIRNTAGGLIQS